MVQHMLGISDELIARALPRVMPLMQYDVEGTVLPRVDWLVKALEGACLPVPDCTVVGAIRKAIAMLYTLTRLHLADRWHLPGVIALLIV